MNIIEALNKLKENPNIAIKCGDTTYMKRDRMGVLYKCIEIYKRIKKDKFHREETFLPLDKITTAYFSLEEVLSNDWELVED